MATQKFYAVKSDNVRGVYSDWEEAKKKMSNSTATLKIFTEEDAAYEYLYSDPITVPTSSQISSKQGEVTVSPATTTTRQGRRTYTFPSSTSNTTATIPKHGTYTFLDNGSIVEHYNMNADTPAISVSRQERRRALATTEEEYYAVALGAKCGVYTSLEDVQGQNYESFRTKEKAQQWIIDAQVKSVSAKTGIISRPGAKGSKFYAVKVGVKPGVYTTWAECQKNVVGFKNALYKSFATEAEAIAFVGVDSPKPTSFRYRIFTDGSFIEGKCGAAAALYEYNKLVADCKTHIANGTNNVGELTGIYDGLQLFIDYCKRNAEDNYEMAIEIVTDSQYCVSLFTAYYDTWTEKEKRDAPNSELIKKIAEVLKKFRTDDKMTIIFTHINSHQKSDDPDSDISHNNYVDELANDAALVCK